METYRYLSQIINTDLNHIKGLLAPENTPYALPFTFLRGAKPARRSSSQAGCIAGNTPASQHARGYRMKSNPKSSPAAFCSCTA